MQPRSQAPQEEIELKIVGGNTFGRTNKISAEQTFNMMISDNWLVQTPGYKKVINVPGNVRGRGNFTSTPGGFMLEVVSNIVYKVTGPQDNIHKAPLFLLDTFSGDVSFDENAASQIAICDGLDVWIYNYTTNTATAATLPINGTTGLTITPGYVTYHDGYFIVPDTTSTNWYLSQLNDGLVWNWGAGGTYVFGAIQTKSDNAVAVVRAPSKGNLIYVFSKNVMEFWYNNGQQLFPYQRTNSASVDYGCLSSNTISALDNYIAWLGVNEKSGPVIMTSDGQSFKRLSNDGIDFRLADLVRPEKSYAFFYKIDGHVFYQITFFDDEDNLTLIYDFNTEKFFYLTDENMNYHIAASVAFFNNTYYFVSLNDGSTYQMDSYFYTYDYTDPLDPTIDKDYDIPRVRICNHIRRNDTSPFIATSLTFTIEQGVDPNFNFSHFFYLTTEQGEVLTTEVQPGYIGQYLTDQTTIQAYVPAVDMCLSKDGGESYGSWVRRELNPLGNRRNRLTYFGMGQANDLVCKIRFISRYRVTVSDGLIQTRINQG